MSRDCFILQGRFHGDHTIEKSQKFLLKSLSVSSVVTLGYFDKHVEPWREDCLKRTPHSTIARLVHSIHGRVSMSIWSHTVKTASFPLSVFTIFLQPHPMSQLPSPTIKLVIDLPFTVFPPLYSPQHSFIHSRLLWKMKSNSYLIA